MNILERLAEFARPILEYPLVKRTRRNHSLEHATIHVLSQRNRNLKIGGRSSHDGFVLMGNATPEQIETASKDALNRLKKGEKQLAIHPNCGTNLVTTAVLATVVASVTRRIADKNRFSFTLYGMVVALLVGQPLGMALQKHFTTAEGDMGDLEVDTVETKTMTVPLIGQEITLYQVNTRHG